MPQQVELQRKLAFPFVTLVMTLLAVPFGVTTGRRGALYGIGLGIVIALSYWMVMSVFVAIGKSGLLSPALAAWTPNIIVARRRRLPVPDREDLTEVSGLGLWHGLARSWPVRLRRPTSGPRSRT